MEEKKKIKISLGTIIYVTIIVVLVIALGTVYYLGFVKNNSQTLKEENLKLKNEIMELKNQSREFTEEKIKEDSQKIENTYQDSYIYKHIKEGAEVKTLFPEGEIAKIENIEKKDNKYIINAEVYNTIKLTDTELDRLDQVINKYKEESKVYDSETEWMKAGEYLITENNNPYKCKATGIDGEKEYFVYLIAENENPFFDIFLTLDKKEKFYLGREGAISETMKRDVTIKVDNDINFVEYVNIYGDQHFSKKNLPSAYKGELINAIINEKGEILEIVDLSINIYTNSI